MKYLDLTEMKAPEKLSLYSKIKACNYLIEKINNQKFLIHRELQSEEQRFYSSDEIMQYHDTLYLYGIACLDSKEQALLKCRDYWKFVKALNNAQQQPLDVISSGFSLGDYGIDREVKGAN